jgi:hypothetical protein
MFRILTLTILIGLLSLSSCSKKTKSDFILIQTEYAAGERLSFEVTKNKRNQIWTIESSIGEMIQRMDTTSPNFRLNLLMPDGLYSLNVYDNETEFADNVKKSEPFVVKTERATLDVRQVGSGPDDYVVWLDYEEVGTGDENGDLEIEIPIGVYYIHIYTNSGTFIESETINLETPGDTYNYYL